MQIKGENILFAILLIDENKEMQPKYILLIEIKKKNNKSLINPLSRPNES